MSESITYSRIRKAISTGVPQGCVSTPVLFTLYLWHTSILTLGCWCGWQSLCAGKIQAAVSGTGCYEGDGENEKLSPQAVYEQCVRRQAQRVLQDVSQSDFELLPSGKRYRLPKCRFNRTRTHFYQAPKWLLSLRECIWPQDCAITWCSKLLLI